MVAAIALGIASPFDPGPQKSQVGRTDQVIGICRARGSRAENQPFRPANAA
jgi:hypothetical protein